jgi:hypothetical protein
VVGAPATPAPAAPAPAAVTVPTVSWSSAKSAFSRFVGGGGGGTSAGKSRMRSATSRVVKAHGGSRGASSSATAGRSTAQALGGFLGNVARDGFSEAVKTLALGTFVGRDAAAFVNALVDALAPDGSLLEDAIARKALAETLATVIEKDVDGSGTPFESLNRSGLVEVLRTYVAEYVTSRMLQIVGQRLTSGEISAKDAARTEADVRDFIRETADFTIDDAVLDIDWMGRDGQAVVQQIFEDAYELVGDDEEE